MTPQHHNLSTSVAESAFGHTFYFWQDVTP